MRKLTLKPTANPSNYHYRQYFKDDNKRLYCVEPNEKNVPIMATATKDGEPEAPVPFGLSVWVDGCPVWQTEVGGRLQPAEVTLEDVCRGEYELTDEDRDDLERLLGKSLRQKRRERLKRRLQYAHLQAACDLYKRVSKRMDLDRWELCARQDYDYDLKVIREVFIDGR